jgi:HSP20 family molecular chaperone IbpA
MSTLFNERTPFDILFRNFFNSDFGYVPAVDTKIPHPLDIFYTDEGLHFEIACTGLTKEDIDIKVEGDEIRFKYEKPKADNNLHEGYIYNGLSRKSFNLGYKIAPKFDLTKAEAEMENGLLKVFIPLAESAKPTSLKIK